MTASIPIFRLEFEPAFVQAFIKGAQDILESGRPLAEGKYVEMFEKRFSQLVNARHTVAVSNGTSALEIALKSIKNVGTVIIPTNTFFATAIAVVNAGHSLALADINSDDLSICPDNLVEKISKTKNVSAVVVVHIGGILSSNLVKVRNICREHNIPLIEDAAHAHMSQLDGEFAGTFGDIGCFSFFPTKVMTTGEGGAVTTNSDQAAQLMRSLKNFGRDKYSGKLCVNPGGNNFKMTEFQGLMGFLECGRVEARIALRNERVRLYVELLKNSSIFEPVLQKGDGLCAYYKMIIKSSIDLRVVAKAFSDANIAITGSVYDIPIHRQPRFETMFSSERFPVADAVASSHFCPPLYPELTLEEVERICSVLNSIR